MPSLWLRNLRLSCIGRALFRKYDSEDGLHASRSSKSLLAFKRLLEINHRDVLKELYRRKINNIRYVFCSKAIYFMVYEKYRSWLLGTIPSLGGRLVRTCLPGRPRRHIPNRYVSPQLACYHSLLGTLTNTCSLRYML